MRFYSTPIAGVVEVSTEWHEDERGTFGRTYCAREFAAHDLDTELAQCSVSIPPCKGTVRGFHIQAPPNGENKLVQCTAGRVFDVALDLRPNSATYGLHYAIELAGNEGRMLYIPKGCAHGFQTLENANSLIYYMFAFYEPASARGVRWNDPDIGVRWPLEVTAMSPRDRQLPSLRDYALGR
jgi:dTDP-4-dehydrorhamnose 3,5-epimerase